MLANAIIPFLELIHLIPTINTAGRRYYLSLMPEDNEV